MSPFDIIALDSVRTEIWMFAMPSTKATASVIAIAILFGFTGGILLAVPPACFALITIIKLVSRTGICQGHALCVFRLLVGGLASGLILGTGGPLHLDSLSSGTLVVPRLLKQDDPFICS
jgi:hypothetical protein